MKKQGGAHGWFGKYLSLALTLPASAAGGYLIGLGFVHAFHQDYWIAVFIILGMAAGIFQVVKELLRDLER